MAKIPVRFKRVAAVFDEMSRAKFCESSGSEYSAQESLTDLSELVNSFLENEKQVSGDRGEVEEENAGREGKKHSDDLEMKNELKRLFGCEEDNVKKEIYGEVEEAISAAGSSSSPGFKRRLMARLRDRGLDAGLCKSKWEKTTQFPSGNYEYVDVKFTETRYIIEVFLVGDFELARATKHYCSLLSTFPLIAIITVDELKQIVRLMSKAIKNSMRKMDMHVPPWRRHGYMQSKWLGSCKRTIDEIPVKKGADSNEDLGRKRTVGFEPLPPISYCCREDFSSKAGIKVSSLAVALNGTSILL